MTERKNTTRHGEKAQRKFKEKYGTEISEEKAKKIDRQFREKFEKLDVFSDGYDINKERNRYKVDNKIDNAASQADVFSEVLDALFARHGLRKKEDFNKKQNSKYKFSDIEEEVGTPNNDKKHLEQLKKSKIWINNCLEYNAKIKLLEELSTCYGRKILGAWDSGAEIEYQMIKKNRKSS